jgi:hypothetical protein
VPYIGLETHCLIGPSEMEMISGGEAAEGKEDVFLMGMLLL